MVPSVQESSDMCCMCGWPVEITFEPHASGNPEYRTKKTECTNISCHARMYELKKFAVEETPKEFDLPIPHLKGHVNNMKCQLCGHRTNKLYMGKATLCCEDCYKQEKMQ